MRVIADLHIHSRYSRATSSRINIENLVKYARIKGIGLLGTGDFTHPSWLGELKEDLTEDDSGILRDKSGFPFILTSEISSIYKDGGRVRRIHNIIHAPGFGVADQINEALRKRGVNLDSDGRPICGIHCPELVDIVRGVDSRCEIIPAHVWTPWFSLFGSMSGFDSVEECFKDQTKHIFALETGLSSDPAMNWRLSALDRYALVSNSDAHSFWPWRIGREANVFELPEATYEGIFSAIREKDPKRFLFTIETEPAYGKYHMDGHRACNVCLEPKQSMKIRKICPKCGRPLTIGVLQRVEELADRPAGFRPEGAIPFKSLVPLSEIIASVIGTQQLYSRKVQAEHEKLVSRFGSEFAVLLDTPENELRGVAGGRMAEAIIKVRQGRVNIRPGFDGEYGRPVFDESPGDIRKGPEPTEKRRQKSLADFSSQ